MDNGSPQTPPSPRSTGKYILLLGLMCALPAVTSDIYVPSLPDVARDLDTSTTAVQLTMTGVLVGAPSASSWSARSRAASAGGSRCSSGSPCTS